MNDSTPPLPAAGSPPKRRANGCLIAVVATVVLGVLILAFGGYYAMMHSGMPLRWFAATINASDQAKIEGLEGSLATGFRFDEFRVFKTGRGDSYIRNFNFEFNGMPGISSSGELVIDRFHIGRIYLSLPTNNVGVTTRNPEFEKEFNQGMQHQRGGELKRFELKSFRIDEVLLQDAAGEREVGSVKLLGLVSEGERVQVDAFELVSDHIDAHLDSSPGTNRFSQVIRGVVRTSLHTNVLRDFDFAINFGGATNAGAARIEVFDGQLVASSERDGTSVVLLNDFSPGEWLGGFNRATPSRMTFSITGNKSGKRSKVSAGSLVLGRTEYQVPLQELDHGSFGGPKLGALAKVGGLKIAVEISQPEGGRGFRYKFHNEQLQGDALLARALFGKALEKLTEPELAELNAFRGPAGGRAGPVANAATPAAP